MTLMDKMQNDERTLRALIEARPDLFETANNPNLRIEKLELKRKKPRLSKLLGEHHPLAGDDAALLREYFRLTKGN